MLCSFCVVPHSTYVCRFHAHAVSREAVTYVTALLPAALGTFPHHCPPGSIARIPWHVQAWPLRTFPNGAAPYRFL